MTAPTVEVYSEADLARLDIAQLKLEELELARMHPTALAPYVRCVDEKTGEVFTFEVDDPNAGWYWQRDLLEWWLSNPETIVLKGRQLGVTWCACLVALHDILFVPGSSVLAYSINEDEAAELIGRIWQMFKSLPEHFRHHVQVLKPARGHEAHVEIELRHRDGKISTVTGMSSTAKAGHGRTARRIIADEAARQDRFADIWKAIIPVIADGGSIIVISTANGVSNEQTGGGNFYHHLYSHAGDAGYPKLKSRFLRYDLHPRRGEHWRTTLSMKEDQKAEQYPLDEQMAFLMSGRPFFDRLALVHYRKVARDPEYRGEFVSEQNGSVARFKRDEEGSVYVFAEPEEDADYAIAADVATGHGLDYSVAAIIHLGTGEPVCELHAKLEADLFAEQLHFLGRWYNTAVIAVEDQGGYGLPVILSLRDGRKGRPAYPNLYRHTEEDRPDMPQRVRYGYPVTNKSRPQMINQLEQWVRDRLLPYVSKGLSWEMATFVRKDTGTSPRAEDGSNDDRVLAWAGALELYRQRGYHPNRVKRKNRTKKKGGYVPPHKRTGAL